MEEIMIVFDRNDELTAVDTCDCACDAGQLTPRMFLSYNLINTSTTTRIHIDVGTRLSDILDVKLIHSTLLPIREDVKYNDDDDDDEPDYID